MRSLDADDAIPESVVRDHERWTTACLERGYFRACLRLTPTDEGGRKRPIYSGYRSCWFWGERTENGGEMGHDAPITMEGELRLDLGDEAVVRLLPLFPEYWHNITTGSRLEMREGARVVGVATVLDWVPATG